MPHHSRAATADEVPSVTSYGQVIEYIQGTSTTTSPQQPESPIYTCPSPYRNDAAASSAATTANNMVAGITNGMSMSTAYTKMPFAVYSSSSNTMHPQHSSPPSIHSLPGIMPVSNVAPNFAMATAELSSQMDIQQMAMSSAVASGSAVGAVDDGFSVGNGSVGGIGACGGGSGVIQW